MFFSSFGWTGMTGFPLMMKLNGACQHSGNKGIHVKKLGCPFSEQTGSVPFMAISTFLIQNRYNAGLDENGRILRGLFLKGGMSFPVAIMHGGQIGD